MRGIVRVRPFRAVGAILRVLAEAVFDALLRAVLAVLVLVPALAATPPPARAQDGAAGTPVAEAAAEAELESRVAALEAEVAALRAEVAARSGADATPAPVPAGGRVSPAVPAAATAAVGDTVAVVDPIGDLYDLTVTKVERDRAFETVFRHEANGVFILIDFEVTNRGRDETFLVPEEWTIVDGQGRTFNLSQDAQSSWRAYTGQDLEDSLQPDVTYGWTMLFDIAPTATDLSLLIGGTNVAIDLGY